LLCYFDFFGFGVFPTNFYAGHIGIAWSTMKKVLKSVIPKITIVVSGPALGIGRLKTWKAMISKSCERKKRRFSGTVLSSKERNRITKFSEQIFNSTKAVPSRCLYFN